MLVFVKRKSTVLAERFLRNSSSALEKVANKLGTVGTKFHVDVVANPEVSDETLAVATEIVDGEVEEELENEEVYDEYENRLETEQTVVDLEGTDITVRGELSSVKLNGQVIWTSTREETPPTARPAVFDPEHYPEASTQLS